MSSVKSYPSWGRSFAAALVAVIVAGMPGISAKAYAADPSNEAVVSGVLEASARAWSKGDLDRFMQCYEDSSVPTYVKGGDVVHGFQAIHDMYAARFGGGGSMGRLSMTVLDFKPLGDDYALVTGRYKLVRAPAADAGGVFTLVFHKSAAGWRIISDHTS
jgi:uncharacterized protein (TIGR02246 family)